MATRSNIIIKDAEGLKAIIYHHFNGSPKGVGAELQMFLRHITDDENNPTNLAEFICAQDKEYIPRNIINDDIDYLYTINTETKTLHYQDIIDGKPEFLCRYSPHNRHKRSGSKESYQGKTFAT